MKPFFKPLFPFNGRLAVERVVSLYQSVGVTPLVVVSDGEGELAQMVRGLGCAVAVNGDDGSDMLSSVQAGVAEMPDSTDFFFVHPCDVPAVEAGTILSLGKGMQQPGCLAACPDYRDQIGHPLVLSSRLRNEVLNGKSVYGLHSVLDEADIRVARIPVDDPGVLLDVDKLRDVHGVEQLLAEREGRACTFWLMRHAQVIQRKPRRFVGQEEIALDEVGVEQIMRAGESLRSVDISVAYSSPLSRCVTTAEEIAQHHLSLRVRTVEGLREIALGAWEGLTVDEVRERFPGEYEKRGEDMAEYRPQDGESFRDVQKRGTAVFRELAKTHEGNVLVVAHGGLNRTVISGLLGDDLNELFNIQQDYAHLNLISCHDGKWRVLRVNSDELI